MTEIQNIFSLGVGLFMIGIGLGYTLCWMVEAAKISNKLNKDVVSLKKYLKDKGLI